MGRLSMLVQIAFRNLRASPINLIIGGLILAGTFLFVVVGGLLDSLNEAMARSVVGSVAGHIQIYSSKSKDELSLYGGMGGDPDLSAVTEFPRIKEALEKIDNVKEVVPMGSSGALITAGNIVDRTLERLRNLYKAKEGTVDDPRLKGLSHEELDQRIEATKRHVRQMIKVLESDQKKALAILKDQAIDPEVTEALTKVGQDAFWNDFDKDSWGSLEFLENRIAPQVTDAQLMFLRYLGTDLDRFQQSFDRMQVIDGSPVPKGQRGFLLAKLFYEDQMKLKNARRLDKLRDAIAVGRTIAKDEELQRFVKENRAQTRDYVLQLDDLKTVEVTRRLQGFLNSSDTDVTTLLSAFFDTTDANFEARYLFFYKDLASFIELYKVRVGDTLTIKAFSRGGAIQAINVRVYGTFAFTGLEKSPLAGNTSLMDLMSFRDLYGYLTADKKEELAQLQKDTGAKVVSRENAEDALFGEGNTVVAEATAGVIDEDKTFTGVGRRLREDDLIKRVYSEAEINGGVVLNAAIMVKDPSKLRQTIEAINTAADEQKLEVKAISWQQASGILGQIINFFRGVLLLAIFFIFGIAMVIINNAMMMATIQRTQTIGTMRAIGAQRGLVLSMVLVESLVLGVIFGGLGILLGSGVMALLHTRGIPAPNDVAYFFFSGPKLLPELSVLNLVVASVIILVITLVSTLFPAVIATRISPLRAMQSDE